MANERIFTSIKIGDGYTYDVKIDGTRIVGTSCYSGKQIRWPMCNVPTGSAWLDSQLVRAVQQRIELELHNAESLRIIAKDRYENRS